MQQREWYPPPGPPYVPGEAAGRFLVGLFGRWIGRGVLLLAMLVLLVLPSFWVYKHIAWLSPDGQDIQHVIRGALVAQQDLGVPPLHYRNRPLPPSVAKRMEADEANTLGSYYAGSRLAFWKGVMKDVISREPRHGWVDPIWKVDHVHFDELALYLGSADASAREDVHSVFGKATLRACSKTRRCRLQSEVQKTDFTFHLVKVQGHWRIDRESSEFVPGYGP